MDRTIDLYCDSADLKEIAAWVQEPHVQGITTNPTLMRQAGVTSLQKWAHDALLCIPLDRLANLPLSLPMLAPDLAHMEVQARALAAWAPNIYVKIPIQTGAGEPTLTLIQRLSHDGIKLNVTAVFTLGHVEQVRRAVGGGAACLVSMFAGRIADTGADPRPQLTHAARRLAGTPNARLLWASARQVGDVVQAARAHCDVITLPPALLRKLPTLGKDLDAYSRETVAQFEEDARALRW